jgi:peptidoglycan-N-acetylglucosamine deacetylase
MSMLLSVSIDLDPIWCYQRIYGLDYSQHADRVTATATRRCCELFDALNIKGTFFVVGQTLSSPAAQDALKAAKAAGHEIANHTYSHPYGLSRLGHDEIAAEINQGRDAIEQSLGCKPVGFRAPGYLLGSRVIPAVVASGARYDSSVLPSPIYQGVKALAMGVMKLSGRPSGARLGNPRESLAPAVPYHPDPLRPFKRGSAELIELPISVAIGIPLIGATLALAGPTYAGWLATLSLRKEFVCLELHGIDMMDIISDDLPEELSIQRDLSMPWQRKFEAILAFVKKALRTHQAVTLEEAAKTLS